MMEIGTWLREGDLRSRPGTCVNSTSGIPPVELRSRVRHCRGDGEVAAGLDAGDSDEDRTVLLWDPGTARQYGPLAGFGSTDRLAWSPNGRILAAGSKDDAIRLWSSQGAALGEVRVREKR